MVVLSFINCYFKHKFATQSSECDMRANQSSCGKGFLNSKTDKQDIFRCGCDPGTTDSNFIGRKLIGEKKGWQRAKI